MPFEFTAEEVERLSLKQVAKAFVDSRVARYFPPYKEHEGGTYAGTIARVDSNVSIGKGKNKKRLPGFLFYVK